MRTIKLIAIINHTKLIQICLTRIAATKLAGEIIAQISGLHDEDNE